MSISRRGLFGFIASAFSTPFIPKAAAATTLDKYKRVAEILTSPAIVGAGVAYFRDLASGQGNRLGSARIHFKAHPDLPLLKRPERQKEMLA